jgi:hypothetical protein
LLDIAIGNGLDLPKVWPKELHGVQWPWNQGARAKVRGPMSNIQRRL